MMLITLAATRKSRGSMLRQTSFVSPVPVSVQMQGRMRRSSFPSFLPRLFASTPILSTLAALVLMRVISFVGEVQRGSGNLQKIRIVRKYLTYLIMEVLGRLLLIGKSSRYLKKATEPKTSSTIDFLTHSSFAWSGWSGEATERAEVIPAGLAGATKRDQIILSKVAYSAECNGSVACIETSESN